MHTCIHINTPKYISTYVHAKRIVANSRVAYQNIVVVPSKKDLALKKKDILTQFFQTREKNVMKYISLARS